MSSMPDHAVAIHTIIGSTRQQRFSEKPARWIHDQLTARGGVNATLIDLRDYPLPFFDQPVSPARFQGTYPNPVATEWAHTVDAADGYVVVGPEYNHGYTAVLKNAFDWAFHEWNNKPIAFVSYGGVGGARAVEQMRLVAVELEMAPIRFAVHVSTEVYRAVMNEQVPVDPKLFQSLQPSADRMIDQLLWWTHALKAARLAAPRR
jgi:NAD(P)H-dependent FMN reductase